MSKFKKNKLIIIIVLLCSVLILLNIKNVIIVNNYHKHKPDTILKRKIINVNPSNNNNNNNNLSLPKSLMSNTIYNVAKTEFTAEPKKIVYNTKKYPEEELPQPVNVRTYCLYNNKHELELCAIND
jgi:hypothetical protein